MPALPPLPTWVDRDLEESSSVHSESCWDGMEDRNDEEVGGLLPPPAAVHEVREVASQVPVVSHRPRIPSRLLVLVGGRGIGSQNGESPVQEDLVGETASPHSQVGWAQAVRAPLQADQIDATQPADTPQPHGLGQEPYQRRRLRLLSQSTRTGVGTQFHTIASDVEPMAVADGGNTQMDSSGSETESLEFEDWGSHASGDHHCPRIPFHGIYWNTSPTIRSIWMT